MTKEEIAVLGHAFFDGKTLQYRRGNEPFTDWLEYCCPNFIDSLANWRIKPCEPKTITICTFVSEHGHIAQAVFGSEAFKLRKDNVWTHLKSLDRAVEVE